MQCYCCGAEIALARKVKLRATRDYDPENGGPGSAAYQSYQEEMTFRWSVVCQTCYSTLDNQAGVAEISGTEYNIAGQSRGDKAATIDEAKYRGFQRTEAEKLGLTLDDE